MRLTQAKANRKPSRIEKSREKKKENKQQQLLYLRLSIRCTTAVDEERLVSSGSGSLPSFDPTTRLAIASVSLQSKERKERGD